jgi:nitrogen regulatory protein PII
MELHTIKLVTIIAPKYLKDELIALLRSAEITGYTYYDAFGRGRQQLKEAHGIESRNLQFKILLPEMISVSLMQAIAEKYFGKEKLIIFQQDANVIRYNKFDKIMRD